MGGTRGSSFCAVKGVKAPISAIDYRVPRKRDGVVRGASLSRGKVKGYKGIQTAKGECKRRALELTYSPLNLDLPLVLPMGKDGDDDE
ncbi:hypothetical protein Tco_0126645 [Tanacetum coccineum]